jgi:hypothetical protein
MNANQQRGFLILALLSLLLSPACKQHRRRPVAKAQDDTIAASIVSAGDPRASSQFVKGFYDIESDSWRWTAKEFSVSLSPPRDAAHNGAVLVLEISVPEAVIQKFKSVTLSGAIGDFKLAPEKYNVPGSYSYTRPVPANALQAGTVRADFTLDNALPPSVADSRELGIIVSQAGFKLQ